MSNPPRPTQEEQEEQEKQEKPGWSLTALLLGAVNAVLTLGGVWSWWALLWLPLLAVGVGAVVYEWRLLARSRWHMGSLEWVFLVVAHVGLAASLAAVLAD